MYTTVGRGEVRSLERPKITDTHTQTLVVLETDQHGQTLFIICQHPIIPHHRHYPHPSHLVTTKALTMAPEPIFIPFSIFTDENLPDAPQLAECHVLYGGVPLPITVEVFMECMELAKHGDHVTFFEDVYRASLRKSMLALLIVVRHPRKAQPSVAVLKPSVNEAAGAEHQQCACEARLSALEDKHASLVKQMETFTTRCDDYDHNRETLDFKVKLLVDNVDFLRTAHKDTVAQQKKPGTDVAVSASLHELRQEVKQVKGELKATNKATAAVRTMADDVTRLSASVDRVDKRLESAKSDIFSRCNQRIVDLEKIVKDTSKPQVTSKSQSPSKIDPKVAASIESLTAKLKNAEKKIGELALKRDPASDRNTGKPQDPVVASNINKMLGQHDSKIAKIKAEVLELQNCRITDNNNLDHLENRVSENFIRITAVTERGESIFCGD